MVEKMVVEITGRASTLKREGSNPSASCYFICPSCYLGIQGNCNLTPHNRMWAFLVAEAAPELWERFVAACQRERAEAVAQITVPAIH